MTNWKTTLLGLLAGIAMAFGNVANARVTNPTAPPITFGNLAGPIGIAILGAVAKDFDKTGA